VSDLSIITARTFTYKEIQ